MHTNLEICLGQIREILGLRPHAAPSEIVAAVRDLKQKRGSGGSPAITGTDLKVARIRKGLKAQDVAKAAGLSQSYYSEIENGVKPVTRELLTFVRSNL